MVFRLLILLMVCASSSGCITILKQQKSEPPDVCSMPSEKKPEMTWVEAKTSKIWVSPHLDDNGDMVEGHFKYTVITPGHWAAKGNQP